MQGNLSDEEDTSIEIVLTDNVEEGVRDLTELALNYKNKLRMTTKQLNVCFKENQKLTLENSRQKALNVIQKE